MRNAGTPVPCNQDDTPAIAGATGLGTGGGAGIFSPVGSGWGEVLLYVGNNPSSSGSVTLKFNVTPPTLFFAATDKFGTLSVTGQGTTTIVVSWTGAALAPNSRHQIDYEWSTSK